MVALPCPFGSWILNLLYRVCIAVPNSGCYFLLASALSMLVQTFQQDRGLVKDPRLRIDWPPVASQGGLSYMTFAVVGKVP